MTPIGARSRRFARAAVYGGLAVGISVLHYGTSVEFVLLHEVLRRLYYLPIIAAATRYGPKAGLAMALFASIMYVPHVLNYAGEWPRLEAAQFGELILFIIVGFVTGVVAGRLRAERDRYQRASVELDGALDQMRDDLDERVRVERLATLGRVATGVADRIKNPLGALHGAIEILASEFPRHHPKVEFVDLAKSEIARIDSVIKDFQLLSDARPWLASAETRDTVDSVAASRGPNGVAAERLPAAVRDGRVRGS